MDYYGVQTDDGNTFVGVLKEVFTDWQDWRKWQAMQDAGFGRQFSLREHEPGIFEVYELIWILEAEPGEPDFEKYPAGLLVEGEISLEYLLTWLQLVFDPANVVGMEKID